jgi:ribonuclease HII
LQDIWEHVEAGHSHVLVDKHGGRSRYRRLLLDVFPDCQCDILQEKADRSAYRVADVAGGGRTLLVTFQEGGDARALPTALASMVAKYVREIHMLAFNTYWQQRLEGLKPTAGYHCDARRFMRDIAPALRAGGVDVSALVRRR